MLNLVKFVHCRNRPMCVHDYLDSIIIIKIVIMESCHGNIFSDSYLIAIQFP